MLQKKIPTSQINQKRVSRQFLDSQQATLGTGALGKVLKITTNGNTYALKQIQKTMIDRFGRRQQLDRQIQIMSRLNHQNIVKFISFDQKDPRYYNIFMEYCSGQDLRKFLSSDQYRNHILPTKTQSFAVKVSLHIIYAYTQLRTHLIVNRDIKLDNIMVDVVMKQGKQKIITKMIDFGQAKYYIQQAAAITGTRGYMSPQIYFGTNCFSEACDYWSLGFTFYELFEGVNLYKTQQKSLNCPFKQNFYPKKQNDYFRLYNELIYQDISLNKYRTPGPFRDIIRGLLRVNPNQRLTMTKIVSILITKFNQLKHCFQSEKEAMQQKQKLYICQSKNNEADKKKQKVDSYFSKMKKTYKNLYVVFNKYLPEPRQCKNNVQIIKIILIMINKVLYLMVIILAFMEINNQGDCAIKQLFSSVLSQDQFYNMFSNYRSHQLFFTRNNITIQKVYNGANQQVIRFIKKNIQQDTNQILSQMDQLLRQ